MVVAKATFATLLFCICFYDLSAFLIEKSRATLMRVVQLPCPYHCNEVFRM